MCACASLDVVLKNGLVILFGSILLGGSRLVTTKTKLRVDESVGASILYLGFIQVPTGHCGSECDIM